LALYALLAALSIAAPAARAELIVGLTDANSIVTFDDATPGAVSSPIAITGTSGILFLAIDRRPSSGALYALGLVNGTTEFRLFTLDGATGAATFVSTIESPPNSTLPGFDFNPVADRLRVVDPITDRNLRINVDTGATIVDQQVAYAAGDPHGGQVADIVGSAYTNNFAPSPRTPPPGTTLYGIDSTHDILVLQDPPNDGTLHTIGDLGFDATGQLGFDISGPTGRAYISSVIAGNAGTNFYRVNLGTGAAALVGAVGTANVILLDIAAPVGVPQAVPEPSTLALAAMGGVGLLGYGWRRRKRA
jgi:hypothetical protein